MTLTLWSVRGTTGSVEFHVAMVYRKGRGFAVETDWRPRASGAVWMTWPGGGRTYATPEAALRAAKRRKRSLTADYRARWEKPIVRKLA